MDALRGADSRGNSRLRRCPGSVIKGILLLAIYSLGLAVPFLLTSLGIGRFLKFYSRFRPTCMPWKSPVAVCYRAGRLLVTGRFTLIASYFSFLNRFAL